MFDKKGKKRALFICNTPYQVLVALWIKYHMLHDEPVHFIISDHMNDGQAITDRLKQTGIVEEAFFVRSHAYSYHKMKLPSKGFRYDRMHPEKGLETFIHLSCSYEEIYFVNFDKFAQLVATSVRHTQRKPPKLILFEEGTSTYSLFFENHYQRTKPQASSGLRSSLARFFYKDFYMYGNVSYALVFYPDLMLWTPSENRKLDTIDKNDYEFLKIVNRTFGYNHDAIEYDKKYIFFEESYYADGNDVGDIQLVEELAKRLGKENIMVKIHPRNPVNRFKELGYKTNSNTSIPWEVICMNMPDLSGKVLITILSGSILEPAILFGKRTRSYSLINLADKAAKVNNPQYLERILYFYRNEKSITICNDLDEIQ